MGLFGKIFGMLGFQSAEPVPAKKSKKKEKSLSTKASYNLKKKEFIEKIDNIKNEEFIVNFNNTDIKQIKVKKGEKVAKPNDPEKKGYLFKGWYADNEFSISYDEDYERAKKAIWDVIDTMDKVLSDPCPFVRVKTHGESTINIVTRLWTKNEDYYG